MVILKWLCQISSIDLEHLLACRACWGYTWLTTRFRLQNKLVPTGSLPQTTSKPNWRFWSHHQWITHFNIVNHRNLWMFFFNIRTLTTYSHLGMSQNKDAYIYGCSKPSLFNKKNNIPILRHSLYWIHLSPVPVPSIHVISIPLVQHTRMCQISTQCFSEPGRNWLLQRGLQCLPCLPSGS